MLALGDSSSSSSSREALDWRDDFLGGSAGSLLSVILIALWPFATCSALMWARMDTTLLSYWIRQSLFAFQGHVTNISLEETFDR